MNFPLRHPQQPQQSQLPQQPQQTPKAQQYQGQNRQQKQWGRSGNQHFRVQQQQQQQVVYGSGIFGKLKGVAPVQNKKRVTGLYVSNMVAKTSCAEVAAHVWRETNVTVRPEKVYRHDGRSCSFILRLEPKSREILRSSNIWPKHVAVRLHHS